MSADISLRPARPEDEDWLLDLRRRVIAPYRAPLGLPNDDAALLVSVREHYQDAQIICHGGRRIGVFKAYCDKEGWILSQIQLEPDMQGRGIGKRLIRTFLDHPDRSGQPVRLLVLHGNPARRLYERLGFREVQVSEFVATLVRPPD
jgi:ribosomal protein S18 acetylase RimI-like enzyme